MATDPTAIHCPVTADLHRHLRTIDIAEAADEYRHRLIDEHTEDTMNDPRELVNAICTAMDRGHISETMLGHTLMAYMHATDNEEVTGTIRALRGTIKCAVAWYAKREADAQIEKEDDYRVDPYWERGDRRY